MVKDLVNDGVVIVGNPKSDRCPIVVVGTARGGTSMAAGVLAKLGIFMGDLAHPPVFEDLRLSRAMEAKDFLAAKEISKEYSERYGKWGWKRPSCINYLDDVDKTLDSPAFLFVYKDILSIARRNNISMLTEILPMMEEALNQYYKSIDFLRKNPYAMLVSYEKAIANPRSFVDSVMRFYNIRASEEQIEDAINFVTPNPSEYLDASRITKAMGRLDGIRDRVIYGWARYQHTKTAAGVNLYINDRLIGTVTADKPRPDLKEEFDQDCAFVYELPQEIVLKAGDRLRARVVNEVRDLNNSPIELKQELPPDDR